MKVEMDNLLTHGCRGEKRIEENDVAGRKRQTLRLKYKEGTLNREDIGRSAVKMYLHYCSPLTLACSNLTVSLTYNGRRN